VILCKGTCMKNPQQTDCPLGPAGLSVVVPVYNSEAFLSELVARIRPVLEKTASTYELILVNDGSRDGSWRVIEELAGRHDWIRGINLMRNFGQHNALLCGIRAARHGIIVTMDDDLQNPPEEIPKLLGGLAGGVDVVYGVPEKSEQGLWRRVSSWIFRAALRKAMGVEAASYASAFRAFRTHIRDAFEQYNHPSVSVDVLLSWGTTGFSRSASSTMPGAREGRTTTSGSLRPMPSTSSRVSARHPCIWPALPVCPLPCSASSFLPMCSRAMSPKGQCPGFSLPGFRHHHLFGGSALLSRHLRRLSRPHIPQDPAVPHLPRAIVRPVGKYLAFIGEGSPTHPAGDVNDGPRNRVQHSWQNRRRRDRDRAGGPRGGGRRHHGKKRTGLARGPGGFLYHRPRDEDPGP